MDAEALKRAALAPRATARAARDGAVAVASRSTPVEALLARIAAEYEALPRQLKSVAKYVEQHRASLMVDRTGDIAARCGVQPSAVVRFAQRFGFPGFSAMQAVFRHDYAEQASPLLSYQQRIRTLIATKRHALTGGMVAREFIAGSMSGLQELARDLDDAQIEAAVGILEKAENIYVVGVRRSFAVAAYIAYALSHTDKRVQLVSGTGGMFREQTGSIHGSDVVIAISFTPYGRETQACVRHAHRRRAKIVVVTDSRLSPLARYAGALLTVKEGSAFAFRSLTSTICLCQALFVALAYRLELNVEETRDRGEYDD
jgi:DNA-binding MurR/RpiR family transcriptional regulator